MWPETERLLRSFYQPYNRLLASLLHDEGFLWRSNVDKDTIGHHHVITNDFQHNETTKPTTVAAVTSGQMALSEANKNRMTSPTVFIPRSFDFNGLPLPKSSYTNAYNDFVSSILGKADDQRVPSSLNEAAEWLSCVSKSF